MSSKLERVTMVKPLWKFGRPGNEVGDDERCFLSMDDGRVREVYGKQARSFQGVIAWAYPPVIQPAESGSLPHAGQFWRTQSGEFAYVGAVCVDAVPESRVIGWVRRESGDLVKILAMTWTRAGGNMGGTEDQFDLITQCPDVKSWEDAKRIRNEEKAAEAKEKEAVKLPEPGEWWETGSHQIALVGAKSYAASSEFCCIGWILNRSGVATNSSWCSDGQMPFDDKREFSLTKHRPDITNWDEARAWMTRT